jgi:DNA-binding CsgD family transcriptional regulator
MVDKTFPFPILHTKLHRVADYIGGILAAFGNDTDRVAPKVSDSPTAPVPALSPQALDEPLTAREIDMMKLLVPHYQDKEIAAQLCIDQTTVKTRLKHLYQKLLFWAHYAQYPPFLPLFGGLHHVSEGVMFRRQGLVTHGKRVNRVRGPIAKWNAYAHDSNR